MIRLFFFFFTKIKHRDLKFHSLQSSGIVPMNCNYRICIFRWRTDVWEGQGKGTGAVHTNSERDILHGQPIVKWRSCYDN